jgi:hypothetical protein
MRTALLMLAILGALSLTSSRAGAFDCFNTPELWRRCACIGERDCSAMQASGNCSEAARCDNKELGAVICSCQTAQRSR